MSRLVDVDELKLELKWLEIDTPVYHDVMSTIDEMPTAEPKHGHWTIEDIVTYERSYGGTLYEPVYKCSCCGRVTESYVRGDEPIMPEDADFPEFCGNCGAKMEVEDVQESD